MYKLIPNPNFNRFIHTSLIENTSDELSYRTGIFLIGAFWCSEFMDIRFTFSPAPKSPHSSPASPAGAEGRRKCGAEWMRRVMNFSRNISHGSSLVKTCVRGRLTPGQECRHGQCTRTIIKCSGDWTGEGGKWGVRKGGTRAAE